MAIGSLHDFIQSASTSPITQLILRYKLSQKAQEKEFDQRKELQDRASKQATDEQARRQALLDQRATMDRMGKSRGQRMGQENTLRMLQRMPGEEAASELEAFMQQAPDITTPDLSSALASLSGPAGAVAGRSMAGIPIGKSLQGIETVGPIAQARSDYASRQAKAEAAAGETEAEQRANRSAYEELKASAPQEIGDYNPGQDYVQIQRSLTTANLRPDSGFNAFLAAMMGGAQSPPGPGTSGQSTPMSSAEIAEARKSLQDLGLTGAPARQKLSELGFSPSEIAKIVAGG